MSEFGSSSPAEGSAPTANPSISKDQWVSFAMRKLSGGYVLLQGPNGKTFSFYKAGEQMQPCAGHAAKRLLATGALEAAKEDARGTHYALKKQVAARRGATA
jgi:hypothetical protein